MFDLTLITYHAKLQVEPTVSDHFAVVSSKRKPPSLAGRPAKHSKRQPFPCHNALCTKQYASSRSLNMHLFKNQACADCVDRLSNEKPAGLF